MLPINLLGSMVPGMAKEAYFMLVLAMAALEAGLVMYLAQRLDAARKMELQRDVIAQQQLYERDQEVIRQEVRSFRHDYKNLLAGLWEQADEGELDQLRTALAELDTGFDRRIGEKIRKYSFAFRGKEVLIIKSPQNYNLFHIFTIILQIRVIQCQYQINERLFGRKGWQCLSISEGGKRYGGLRRNQRGEEYAAI